MNRINTNFTKDGSMPSYRTGGSLKRNIAKPSQLFAGLGTKLEMLFFSLKSPKFKILQMEDKLGAELGTGE